MNIPKAFPQYVGERALFIVTGSEDAKLFLATDGTIENVAAFRVKPPKFDAKEKSLYPLKTHGKQMHQKEFVSTLAENIRSAAGRSRIHHAYLFTPSELKNVVRKALPPGVTQALRKTITGNYLDKSVVELLGMLHA